MHCQKFFRIWHTLLRKKVKITQNYLKRSEYDSFYNYVYNLKRTCNQNDGKSTCLLELGKGMASLINRSREKVINQQ